MKFVKQTGSVEQTFYQGLSSFLNLYATALASSLGREVWEHFALLGVAGSLGVLRAMETFETGSDLSTWTHVGYTDGRQIQFDQPSEYEPSILSEFAGFLPHVTSDGFESFPEDYSAEKMVQAEWIHFQTRSWNFTGNQTFGQGFWTRMFQHWI